MPESDGGGGSAAEHIERTLEDLRAGGDDVMSLHTLQHHTQTDRETACRVLKDLESKNVCMLRGDTVHLI